MKGKNIFWGLFFIVAAGLIVVNQMGYLAGITTLNLVLTILLIPIILKSILSLNFAGVFFPVALLGILFADNLGINDFVPVPILIVAAFLSLGFSLVFSKQIKVKLGAFTIDGHDEHFDQVVNTEDEDNVSLGVKFGSSIKYVNSKNLKQANFSCSFGALKIYLDNATISPEGAVINLDISFSGVEMYVPKEWKVINGIDATLAGVEEKYKRNGEETATIKLAGKASFSGIEIIYI